MRTHAICSTKEKSQKSEWLEGDEKEEVSKNSFSPFSVI